MSELAAMLVGTQPVYWHEVMRCEWCWALIQREGSAKHAEWHQKIDGWIEAEEERRLEEYDRQ